MHTSPQVTKGPTLQQSAYHHIRELLLNSNLNTSSLLSEVALAREMGISRTPVREAISQLVSEGWVERTKGIGVLVKPISRRGLEELMELRTELEGYFTARAARQITETQLIELRTILSHLGATARKIVDTFAATGEWDQALCHELRLTDNAFHWILIEAANVPRTAKIISDLGLIGNWFTSKEQRTTRSLARAHLLHWRIYQAVRRRDPHAARRAARRPNLESKRQLLALYDRQELQFYPESKVHAQWREALARVEVTRPRRAP